MARSAKSDRDTNDAGKTNGQQHQLKCHREQMQDLAEHRHAALPGHPQVATREAQHVGEKLLDHWLIELKFCTDRT